MYLRAVYNHVLRLNLDNLQWSLVDNYGDIPGVRMGKSSSSRSVRPRNLPSKVTLPVCGKEIN
jgi:hypothetical protein